MKIHILTSQPSEKQIEEMLQAFNHFIKLAVDVERGILAVRIFKGDQ